MWTAEIKKVVKNELDIDLEVEFTNGVTQNLIPFKISDPSSVHSIIKRQLDQYEKIEKSNLSLGPVTFVTPEVVEPTEKEIEERLYQQKKNELVVLKQDLDLKLITQEEYDTALVAIKK